MATRLKQFCCILRTSLPKFDPCISQEKPFDVLLKHTCLAKALQNCEKILFMHCIFVGYVSGQATYCVESLHTEKKLHEGKQ